MTVLKNLPSKLWVIALYAVVIIVIIQIVFHRGSLVQNIVFSIILWWLFAPGILFFWRYSEIDIIERIVYGSIAGSVASGLLMYYLGFFGISLILAAYAAPGVLIGGVFAYWKIFSDRKTK